MTTATGLSADEQKMLWDAIFKYHNDKFESPDIVNAIVDAMAEARAMKARELLRRFEWSWNAKDEVMWCTACGNRKSIGHTRDCPVAAELARGKT